MKRNVIILICSILIMILLVLVAVRAYYKNSPDYNYITAKQDIKNKKIRIINIGIRKPSSKDKEIDSIELEFGFKNTYIGYDTTRQIIAGINNYNEIMEAYLKMRNGLNWRQHYQRKVDSLSKMAQ